MGFHLPAFHMTTRNVCFTNYLRGNILPHSLGGAVQHLWFRAISLSLPPSFLTFFPSVYSLKQSILPQFAKMPWLGLSRNNSSEEMMKSMNPSPPSPPPSNCSVTFIPAMMDGSCGTSPTMQRLSLMQMIAMDVKVMAQNLMCIPEMVCSMLTLEMVFSMCDSWTNTRDLCLQTILCTIEMFMIVLVIPCFLAMPGIAFMCTCCMCACAIKVLCWPMNGVRVMRCIANGKTKENQDKFTDERWLYINGAMTR